MGSNINRIGKKIIVNGRGRLEDPDLDGSIIVKLILKKYENGM
jgi:hypothetical protein